MLVACNVLAYNVNLFIDHVLENCAPYVDKIIISHSLRPWGYVPQSRETKRNPTSMERLEAAVKRLKVLGYSVPVQIISGDWETEHEMRNQALSVAKDEGFDWFIIQDADEFYTEASWAYLKRTLESDSTCDCVWTSWYIFWKSSQLVIQHSTGSIKDNNVGFAIRCKSATGFVRGRSSNAQTKRLVDASCYHYAYVMSDEQMLEKVTTWGHANDFNAERWLKHKWKNWTPETKNLNPLHPPQWTRAVRFPNEQPTFAQYFDLPIDLDAKQRGRDSLKDYYWDARAYWLEKCRVTKQKLKDF